MRRKVHRTEAKSVWLQVRIDPTTKQNLEAMAARLDCSMSMLVRNLVRAEVRKEADRG